MSNADLGKREFLELASAYGVVDVEPNGQDTVYVFVRSGLTPSQAKLVRELALEWWSVSRVLVTVRSTVAMKAVSLPLPTEIKFRR